MALKNAGQKNVRQKIDRREEKNERWKAEERS